MRTATDLLTIGKRPYDKSQQYPLNEQFLKDNERFVGKLRLEGSCIQRFSWATTSIGICLNMKRAPATYLPNCLRRACSELHTQIGEVWAKDA